MSEQNTIKLVAEVVDKYSGPLKQMMDSLKKIGEGTRQINRDGGKQVNEHEKAYRQLRDQVVALRTKGIDVARPALSEMGITILSVSGAIAAMGAAVVKSAKDWADWGQQLGLAQRASGLQIDTMRGLANANERFGVSQESTLKSLEEFGQHMDQLHRRSPAYMNAWKAIGANAWREIAGPLLRLDGNREEQLRRAMEIIPKIKDVDQRRRVLALLGLPENWATLTDREMQDMRRKADEFARAHPLSVESARKMKDAWEDVRSSMRGLSSDIGETFGPAGVSILHGYSAALENLDHWLEKLRNRVRGDSKSGARIPALPLDRSSILGRLLLGEATPNQRVDEAFKSLDTKKGEDTVAQGTRRGVLDALREWGAQWKSDHGGGGDYKPMAYHPPGTGGGGGYFGSRDYPAIDPSRVPKSTAKDASGANVPVDTSGLPTSGTLAEQRQRFAKELESNPALRDKVMRIAANEQGRNAKGTQAIIESMMNRAIVRGTSLEKQARWHRSEGGYYDEGNMGRGALENPSSREVLEQSLKNALSGSNISNYATDNSSGDLAARERATGKFRFRQGYTGESFFAPGWAEPSLAKRWDAWRERMLAAEPHGAHLRDMVRRGRPPSDAELLRKGMKGVDAGSLRNSLDVKVGLDGFPRGTKISATPNGSIFKEVVLDRGRPMLKASETS